MRKIVILGLLAMAGLAFAQGTPATAIQEMLSRPISLPWLASRAAEEVCGLPQREDWTGILLFGTGCYSVPDLPTDTVVWDLTQTLRATGDWFLVDEFSRDLEGSPRALAQMWKRDTFVDRYLSVYYLLDSVPARFLVIHFVTEDSDD